MSSTVNIIFNLILTSTILRLMGAQVTEWEKKILEAHNNYRRSVYPSGSNLNELSWNTDLANLAVTFAKRCVFEHSSSGERNGAGENIAKTGYDDPIRLSMLWFDERKWYNYNSTLGVCKAPPSGTCGHYVMVVRDEINKLGCATQECGNAFITFCEYSAGPKQEEPYKKGAPCSACPIGFEYCNGGLCAANPKTNCRLTCKNCGTLNTERCTCKCAGLSNSNDCSVMEGPVTGTCGQCEKLGTPCLNNGNDVSTGGTCSCGCKPEFVGPFCQVSKIELDSAAALQIRGPLSDKATYPTAPSTFTQDIFPRLRKEIIEEAKQFCKKNPSSCGGVALNEDMVKELPTMTNAMKDGRLRTAIILDLGNGKYFPQDSMVTVLQSVASTSSVFKEKNITLASLQKADPSLFIIPPDPPDIEGSSGLPAIIIVLIVLFALVVVGTIVVAVILKVKPPQLSHVVNYMYEHGAPNKSPRSAQVTPSKPH